MKKDRTNKTPQKSIDYSRGYMAGRHKLNTDSKPVYVAAAVYTMDIEEEHLRFMHWLRIKFHESPNWDTGIATTRIVDMFKNDTDFQQRYYREIKPKN